MRELVEIKQNKRLIIKEIAEDGGWAVARLTRSIGLVMIVFSWGEGWDHVSASYENRCCTWEEMCEIKDMFFCEDECVIQYHPPKKDYVNIHPYCLHLWKPQGLSIPRPPKELVG